jgi:hypothetical protein
MLTPEQLARMDAETQRRYASAVESSKVWPDADDLWTISIVERAVRMEEAISPLAVRAKGLADCGCNECKDEAMGVLDEIAALAPTERSKT